MSYNKTIESLVEENESLKRQNDMLQNALIKSYVEDEEGNLLSYDVLKQENDMLNVENRDWHNRNMILVEENQQLKQKKKEAYKWAYSLEKEKAYLKKDFDFFYDEAFMNKKELEHQLEQNTQLKKEIVELKTEIVDHRVKEYRLTKILNETSDLT